MNFVFIFMNIINSTIIGVNVEFERPEARALKPDNSARVWTPSLR